MRARQPEQPESKRLSKQSRIPTFDAKRYSWALAKRCLLPGSQPFRQVDSAMEEAPRITRENDIPYTAFDDNSPGTFSLADILERMPESLPLTN